MCVAVKREREEAGRSGTKASVTTDHTNGCLEAAISIRPENCLCVGVGTSSSRLKGSKGAEG